MATYFTLKELCSSPTAKKQGIDNFPSFEIADHLRDLTKKILDPLREAWGGPIRVNSGYRCQALNSLVGGARQSAHMTGYAADLFPTNGMIETFIRFARKWLDDNNIPYDQLIRETDHKTVWMHIGLYGPNGRQRRQYLDLVKK